MTALIVDDEEDIRDLLAFGLGQMGYDVHKVENTVLARKWLKSHAPDLIILDIMMPDGNGLDLCRWIRAEERLAKVPVIVASALKDDETIQDALELGAIDFLLKPFSFEVLHEKIRRLSRPPDIQP